MLEQGDFTEGQEKEVILGDTKKSIVSTATYQVWFPGVHLILQMDPQSSPISGVLEVSASTQRSHSLRNWNQSQSQKISVHTKEILNMYIIHGLR